MKRELTLLLLFAAMQATGHPQGLPSAPQASAPQVTGGSAGASEQVEQALRAHNTAAALEKYKAMIAADPRSSQAWTGMGVLLYGSGRAAEAEEALSHALSIDATAPRAELFLALSQADRHECSKALPPLARYFASETPGKLQRLVGLTLLQCSTGPNDAEQALRIAAQLRQSYPDDADVLYESAELYTRMWSQTAEELMSAHPDSYRVHQLAAEVNEAQGNLEQAIRQYRAALGQNPKLPQMHYRVGQLLLKIGSEDANDKAIAEFREELAINPQSAVAALAIAEIDRHQGKLEAADTEYHQALALEPGLPEARLGLAQTMLAQHRVDAAQSLLRALIAEQPDNAQAHYSMMLAWREQGKLAEASAEMATFQQLQHTNTDQFQKKLNALLTGANQGANSGAGPTSRQ